jgi:hypothetical protein
MEMKKVPTSVMVVSILGIIYGGMMVVCVPVNIVLMVTPLMPNPVLDVLRHDQTYVTLYLVTSAIGFVMGLMLLASSIGSLKLKPWARVGMNVYAVAHVLTTMMGTAITIMYVLPRTKEALANGPGGEAAMKVGVIGGAVGAVLGVLFAMAVAVVILVVFNRRAAVDAFKGIFPEEEATLPGEYPGLQG